MQEDLHNLVLGFIERDKANMHYSVVFELDEIVTVKPNSVILTGMLSISGKDYEKGFIEYKAALSRTSSHFHRIRYYSSGSLRRINPLNPDPRYSREFEALNRMIDSKAASSEIRGDEGGGCRGTEIDHR